MSAAKPTVGKKMAAQSRAGLQALQRRAGIEEDMRISAHLF